MSKRSMINWCIVPLFVLLVAGCGGGENNSPTISGIAAAGSTLAGTVYLKDSSVPARELSVPIAADGSFSLDLKGLTAPFLLKAVGTANGTNLTLYSFATATGITNINPLSTLAVVLANGSDDLAALYGAPDPTTFNAIMAALPNAVTTIQTVLEPTLVKFGAATVNFITDRYVANHQGLDLFLDMAVISAHNGVVTMTDRTTNSTIQRPLSGFTAGSMDIVADPSTTAGSVLVWPALSAVAPNATVTFTAVVIGSANSQVAWSVAEDNGGTITNAGTYTAPATTGTYHVKATNTTDPTKSAEVPVVVRVENFLYLYRSGPGVFTLMASNLSSIAGIDVTITYDKGTLANPRIATSAVMSGAMVATNISVPGIVRLAALSTQPISGSGDLATISFDVLGSSPDRLPDLHVTLVINATAVLTPTFTDPTPITFEQGSSTPVLGVGTP